MKVWTTDKWSTTEQHSYITVYMLYKKVPDVNSRFKKNVVKLSLSVVGWVNRWLLLYWKHNAIIFRFPETE